MESLSDWLYGTVSASSLSLSSALSRSSTALSGDITARLARSLSVAVKLM